MGKTKYICKLPSKLFWKTGFLDVTKTNQKQLPNSFHVSNVLFNIIFAISLQLVASKLWHVPSIFACFHLTLTHYICSLTETMSRKFRKNFESRLGGSWKDVYFLKTSKWQHKLVWDYKQGKMVSYFLNNDNKTCLYGLKVLENIEIEDVFQPKHFFISVVISTQAVSSSLSIQFCNLAPFSTFLGVASILMMCLCQYSELTCNQFNLTILNRYSIMSNSWIFLLVVKRLTN